MEFKFIDRAIENIELNLEVLQKNANNYTMLLMQHKGVFSVRGEKFGNEADCANKFSAFIRLAKTENVSLAVTPEYSCPWDSIIEVIQEQINWPNRSKLWALCCESITPDELREFTEEYSSSNVLIHYDDETLNHGAGVLLDPVCYIFKANINQVEKLVILVQFKTQHMGVWATSAERDRYIPGREIYVLRNAADSIYLFTNICSEAANFSITNQFKAQLDHRWDEQPYIVLSPQMNPKPSHEYFKDFRKSILGYLHKDVISLNWAGGTTLSGETLPLIPYSKSSIVFKSSEVDFDNPARFSSNHKKGLYYLNRKANNHAYYLNPSEENFLIRHQKPVSSGIPGALSRRTGPEILKVFRWNGETTFWSEIDNVDDGLQGVLNELNCQNAILRSDEVSFIDKERLVSISYGKVSISPDDKRWYRIEKLEAFVQDESEMTKRLTYVYDDLGKDLRTDYIVCIDSLNDIIIPNEELIPENLRVFKGNCRQIMFYNDGVYDYKYNLVTRDSQHRATVAYIGRRNVEEAMKTLRQLQALFEKSDQSKKRVVVWYKQTEREIKSVCDELPPLITDDSTEDPDSIAKV